MKADLNTPENQHRFKMGEFPIGSDIIPNPYNQIPGFRIREHHFVPGFPVMAAPMMAWCLDTYYQDLFHQVNVERDLFRSHAAGHEYAAQHYIIGRHPGFAAGRYVVP